MQKVAVITGINRGIGLATAKMFLNNNYEVFGTSRKNIPIKDSNLITVNLEITDEKSIIEAAGKIKKRIKKIDVLVNNAGISIDFQEKKVDLEKLRTTLEVNLIGLISFTEKLIPKIKNGHIINVSSQSGSISSVHGAYMPSYKISKAALNMYTRTLAERLRPEKILVSSIDPGWVQTDMGGVNASREPEDAAKDIFELSQRKNIDSGYFWFKGEKRSW